MVFQFCDQMETCMKTMQIDDYWNCPECCFSGLPWHRYIVQSSPVFVTYKSAFFIYPIYTLNITSSKHLVSWNFSEIYKGFFKLRVLKTWDYFLVTNWHFKTCFKQNTVVLLFFILPVIFWFAMYEFVNGSNFICVQVEKKKKIDNIFRFVLFDFRVLSFCILLV